ncbi:YncE family protein [Streptomyces sp. NPDC049555]|uniref:YncE family protein n=1 Tax=Streptomyces sp. NPDC049555 TaxID=3154930 RepID=UPI003428705A
MTVGKLKEWLRSLSSAGQELALPDGLPDDLGDLKNAVNVGALADWFTVGAVLRDLDPDPDNLCLSGTIAPGTPTLSLWFFTADTSDSVPDDAEIIGVQLALSLEHQPVLSALSGIGLQDVRLVYEIRMLDGAAVRKLFAQADLAVQGGDPLLITCDLDFDAAAQKSFVFTVEPEAGKEWHIAEAFFGMFGAIPPPVLKDIALARLMLAYDRGDTTGFRMEVDARFPLGAVTADLDVEVALAKQAEGGGYDQQYAARLLLDVPGPDGDDDVRTLVFAIKDAEHAEFTASCEDSKGVSFADLARLLGVHDESAAEVLARLGTVTGLTVGYGSARKSIVLAAKEKAGGSLVVVSDRPTDGTRAWAVRVGVGLDAKLSDVPLLHGQIPADQDLGVSGLGVLLTSEKIDADRVTELNKALAASDDTLPQLPADGLGKGMAFTIDLQLPGHSGTTSVVVRGDSHTSKVSAPAETSAQPRVVTQDGAPVPGDAEAAPTGLPLVAWVTIQRNVGPLNLGRVGVGFADDTVWVLFDASLGMAGLTVGVDGLGLGIPLSDPTAPQFRLDGLSVGYSRPPLAIEGALVNRPPDDTYNTLVEGALTVKAEEFGLTALGAYAQTKAHPDQPSLFLFGKVNGEFGGPPPVQVTGIMAGFGLNTDLRLPDGDQVLDFPFLADMSSTETKPLVVLENLMGGQDAWVRPAAGQLWFAAGLEFKVFEFLSGQALLVLEAGDDFAVAVLGTAEAQFPKDQSLPAYAKVRLGLSAKYRASEGVLKLTAQLAPGSFLLSEDCVLTGGFALYTWFTGENAGDFVLTLGGYYPGYEVPAHYPQVPRLGFNWPVTSELTISGGSYFALTPGAIMAGGVLDVNFRSGDLHAWLTAHANMLIEWAPFHFDAEIDVSIGVSYVLDLWLVRETISVEVGASLHLWGPPTGGEVTVHLWFISFTIGFGDGNTDGDKAAPWTDVVKQLPAAQDAVRLVPMGGLTPVKSTDEPDLWTVGTGAFSFAVRTAIPLSKLSLTKESGTQDITTDRINIRPRRDDGKDLDSVLTVKLTKGSDTHDLSAWYAGEAAQNRAGMPAALWGSYTDKLGSKQRVDNQLTGVDLQLPQPTPGSTPGPVKAGTIAHDDRTPNGKLPLVRPAVVRAVTAVETAPEQVDAAQPVTVELVAEAAPVPEVRANVAAVTGSQTGALVDQSRDRLFAAMDYLGVSPGTNERLITTDGLVAGDIDAKPVHTIHGKPTASERLYVLGAASVTPVDAQSLTAYEPITLKNAGSAYFSVRPDGTRLCTAALSSQHVESFDITANPPGKAVDLNGNSPAWLPQNARGLSFSPDAGWDYAYATYAQPDQMVLLKFRNGAPTAGRTYGTLASDRVTSTEPADVVPALPWDKTVYIALPQDNTVAKVDVGNLDNPTAQKYFPAGLSPTRLATDPKGRWLYALNAGKSTVTVIDVIDVAKSIATTLRTGTGPIALAASADGRRLYVANAVTGTVSVFDTSGDLPREAAEPVWVGARPIALAVSAAGDRLYVARSKGPEDQEIPPLQVVDVASDQPVLLPVTVPLKDDPVALAVTVPPTVTDTAAAPSVTRITEGGAA